MYVSILSDLMLYAAVFVAAWAIYIIVYLIAARLRWVSNVDRRLVYLGVLCAVFTGFLSWLFLDESFSSPNTFWMATLTAPIAFLGFCAIFIFMGPANVDRSVAFTILTAIKHSGSLASPAGKLIDVIPFERILEKRVRELTSYGLIEVTERGAKVTPSGERTLEFFQWLGRHLNVRPQ